MTSAEFSFNSADDLERQLKKFREQHPKAVLDEAQVRAAQTAALEIDNDTTGKRVTLTIDYGEDA